MSKTNTIARKPLVAITGKGKAAREAAFIAIAVDSYMADTSRVALVATLNAALGDAPTAEQVDVAKREYVIGRVASRLPAGEFPKGTTEAIDKLEFARKLVMHYAAPAKEGTTARKLRAGQLGRRSAVQHRVIRNAEESWSQVKADLGHGNATTDREKAKAKRAPQMAGSTAKGKASAPAKPDHAALVQPAKPLTQDDACAYIMTQASALLQFANKHAKLVPADYGKAVQAFKAAINKAANDRAVAKADAEGKAAEAAK